jgi:hypothetical protein
MKLLVAILVFMIVAQPVRVGFCDMQPIGDSVAHSGMQSGHRQHDSMQHDGMQHAREDGARPNHDCCAPAAKGHGDTCDTMIQCGTCAVAVAVVPVVPALSPVPESALCSYLDDPGVPPSHASPPYRPPIFIS